MKLFHFIVCTKKPLFYYAYYYKMYTLLSTHDMPTSAKYFSYTNVTTGMGFFSAIFQHQHESFFFEIKLSLVYSILIDKSTNGTCELHLIIYVCY